MHFGFAILRYYSGMEIIEILKNVLGADKP